MANQIKVKRGLKTNLPTLALGEIGFTTDTEELYIGGNNGNVKFNQFIEGNINIYVSPTGDDNNHGLTVGSPFQTIQKAFDLIKELSFAHLTAKFIVNLGAGTYASETSVSGILTNQRIEVRGVNVSGGVPTSIIDGQSSSSFGMIFSANMFLYFKDIKVINIVSGANSGTGIQVQDGCDAWFENVHVDNCDFVGLYANSNCKFRVTGGHYNNCQRALRAYSNTSFSIGYNSSGDRPSITNCTIGVETRDDSSGRIDYCNIDGCDTGIWNYHNTRCHVFDCNITNSNEVAILNTAGGQLYNDNNTFSTNIRDFSTGAFASELDFNRSGSKVTYCSSSGNQYTKSGITTEEKFISLKSFTREMFNEKGNKFKVKVKGGFAGTGDKILKCRVNGTSIGQYNSSTDSLQEFEIEIDFVSLGTDSQIAFWSAQEGDGNNKFMFKYDSTIPISTLPFVSFEFWSSATDLASEIKIYDLTVEYFPYSSNADVISQP